MCCLQTTAPRGRACQSLSTDTRASTLTSHTPAGSEKKQGLKCCSCPVVPPFFFFFFLSCENPLKAEQGVRRQRVRLTNGRWFDRAWNAVNLMQLTLCLYYQLCRKWLERLDIHTGVINYFADLLHIFTRNSVMWDFSIYTRAPLRINLMYRTHSTLRYGWNCWYFKTCKKNVVLFSIENVSVLVAASMGLLDFLNIPILMCYKTIISFECNKTI